jgi:hypothetical protein
MVSRPSLEESARLNSTTCGTAIDPIVLQASMDIVADFSADVIFIGEVRTAEGINPVSVNERALK